MSDIADELKQAIHFAKLKLLVDKFRVTLGGSPEREHPPAAGYMFRLTKETIFVHDSLEKPLDNGDRLFLSFVSIGSSAQNASECHVIVLEGTQEPEGVTPKYFSQIVLNDFLGMAEKPTAIFNKIKKAAFAPRRPGPEEGTPPGGLVVQ